MGHILKDGRWMEWFVREDLCWLLLFVLVVVDVWIVEMCDGSDGPYSGGGRLFIESLGFCLRRMNKRVSREYKE